VNDSRVAVEMLSGTLFSYTEKFDWICREAESVALDSDGKLNFSFSW